MDGIASEFLKRIDKAQETNLLVAEMQADINRLRRERNDWMEAARAFDDHLATMRVMLMERLGGCTPQLDCGADRKSVASERCRDTGGQPFDSAPVTLTDAEREAVIRALAYVSAAEWEYGSKRDAEAAATLRGLLERMRQVPSQKNDDHPRNGAVDACETAPQTYVKTYEYRTISNTIGWKDRPFLVDPPEGWRFGFPRRYDPSKDGDMRQWMISHGYPESLANLGLPCTFTAIPEEEGND